MRLELHVTDIDRVALAAATRVTGRTLQVDAGELAAALAADDRLAGVTIEASNPGDSCRLVNVFDVFEPRWKPAGSTFPGLIGEIAGVGEGVTRVLRGAAVAVHTAEPDRFSSVIDMSGPAAEIVPFARTANVSVLAGRAPGVDLDGYARALKDAGARAGAYLARHAPEPSRETIVLALDRPAGSAPLPRVVYVYMLASQQKMTAANEAILYGDNVRGLMPTVLHPNEVLDGAVVAPVWNFGTDTYTIQNHPMISTLYRQHGSALDFAGVIATVSHATQAERARSILMSARLAKHALRADGVVLTKIGGGVPETDLMQTVDACEGLGLRAAVAVWTHGSGGYIDGSLTVFSPRADAIASVGMYDVRLSLPAVERAIGGRQAGPFTDEPGNPPVDARGPIDLQYRDLAGVISQLGGGRVSIEEY